ncbi:DDE domain-containing protein, partial [Pseudoroseomonas wenyumeiae]
RGSFRRAIGGLLLPYYAPPHTKFLTVPVAAKAFFRSARLATGIVPDKVTTDGHGPYPRAILSTLGKQVTHRTSAYRSNGLEQDHRGIKGRIRCMREFKSFSAAERFCRSHDELRNHLRPRIRQNQHVPASRSRMLHLRRAATVLSIFAAGSAYSVSWREVAALARALTEPATSPRWEVAGCGYSASGQRRAGAHHLLRLHPGVEILGRDVAELLGGVAQREVLGHGLLADLYRLVIADTRVQHSDQHQRLGQVLGDAGQVGFQLVHHVVGEAFRRIGQQRG